MISDRIIAVRNDKTIYRDGDSCIKVFRYGFSKADILNEALNQARAEQTGLNIPKIREITEIDGGWAIVSEFIRGKSMAELMRENGNMYPEYIEMLVGLQCEIHKSECCGLFKMKEKLTAKLLKCGLPATVRYKLLSDLDAMPHDEGLCHGDFNPSNIIIDSEGTPFIIDWAHAALGNASADAAKTYLYFLIDGDAETAEFYIKCFCGKSGSDPEYIKKWIPIIAAAQLVGSNAANHEFLMCLLGKFYR